MLRTGPCPVFIRTELGIAVPSVKDASPAARKLIECAACIRAMTGGSAAGGTLPDLSVSDSFQQLST